VSGCGEYYLPKNATLLEPFMKVAKTDYAICAGTLTDVDPGNMWDIAGGYNPNSIAQGMSASYTWPTLSPANGFSGVSYQRSKIRMADITDGTSNTYLIGEKALNFDSYNGNSPTRYDSGDNEPALSGFNTDMYRTSGYGPYQDSDIYRTRWFGSAHAAGCNMAFCDGSVRTITYGINVTVQRSLGNRCDGMFIDDKSF